MTMTKETTSTVLHYRPVLHQNEDMDSGLLYEHMTNTQTPVSMMGTNKDAFSSALPYFFQDRSRMFNNMNDCNDDDVKRPMNSFLLWAKIMRKKYASENPNMHNAEISKLLGKIWNSMTTKEKRPFVEQAEKLRVLHMRAYPNYRYAPKRRKEKRSHRMISPEVAAALHSTLFDVKNIISEQLSQNKNLGQNLKSYGYLRNAFQQKTLHHKNLPYDEKHSSNNIDNNGANSVESSPPSFAQTHSPSSCSDYSIASSLAESTQLVNDSIGYTETDSTMNAGKTTESLTLHYYPQGPNTMTLPINDCMSHQYQTKPNVMHTTSIPYMDFSSSEDSSGSEEEEEQMIGKEFSHFLENKITRKNNSDVNNDEFWSDIGDIIKKGAL